MFSAVDHYQTYGATHIVALLIPLIIGGIWIARGLATGDENIRRRQRIALAVLIVLIRSVRYGMDIYYNRFDIFDLLSLQICHIDLILLVICLIRPNQVLFSFIFMIGVPMGLAVALFPGHVHPVPGVPRAMLFVMSHMMLVAGAFYLSIVEKQKVRIRLFAVYAGMGSLAVIVVYFINRILGTNFLYIMEAPKGTVIENFFQIFGWPGYVFFIVILAVGLMFAMCLISLLIARNLPGWLNKTRQDSL